MTRQWPKGLGSILFGVTLVALAALATTAVPTILVSNEVGWGIVPDNPLAREFRDQAGWLHQRLAHAADLVVLVVAGIPVLIKSDLFPAGP